jgi:predicted DNA-binding protein (MmcQ/YjbR family)
MTGVSVAPKTHPSTQEALSRVEGHRFFRSPYIGRHGWVSLWAETRLDPADLGDLVTEAYEQVAPKHLLRSSRGD